MATRRKENTGRSNGKGSKSRSTRRSPGSTGQGDYYHVELRRNEDFETFRTQDVGDPGHLQRVAGKRAGGSWATVKWLIAKEDAHLEGGTLVPDTQDARDLLRRLRSKPVHLGGDRFQAKPRQSGSSRSGTTGGKKKTGAQAARRTQSSRGKSR